jgi:hypothetical protein
MIETIDLAPEVPDKRLKKAAEEYRRLRAESEAVERERRKYEQARSHAADRDRRRYAEALGAGQEPPDGASEAEQAAALVAVAIRREEELRLAYERLVETVTGQREELRRSAQKRTTESCQDLVHVVEQLALAVGGFADARALERWIDEFPSGRFSPGQFGGYVLGLTTQGGEPPTIRHVLDALERYAERLQQGTAEAEGVAAA